MRLNLIFQFLLFNKHLKDDKLRLLVPWATHNANVDKVSVFLLWPVHVMDQISARNSRKFCACRIYAHVKGSRFFFVFFFFFGGGGFLLSVNFFQNPFSTVSVWFENNYSFVWIF